MNVVEIIKAIVGPLLILIVGRLTYDIVHGNVHEASSFGLNGVIAILSSMGTGYVLWAYGKKGDH